MIPVRRKSELLSDLRGRSLVITKSEGGERHKKLPDPAVSTEYIHTVCYQINVKGIGQIAGIFLIGGIGLLNIKLLVRS